MEQSGETAILRCQRDRLFEAALAIFKLLMQKSDFNGGHSNSREEELGFIGFFGMEFDANLSRGFAPTATHNGYMVFAAY
jgi:hypothetical protein